MRMKYSLDKGVCSRDPEEAQYDGMEGHEHTYGIKPEFIE